jgi:hypothetical protein
MTNAELLAQCKIGLNIPVGNTAFDGVLTQKLLAVKSFMRSGGVSEAWLEDDLAVGAIVAGVTDIWNLTGGDIKFSPVTLMLITQLACRPLPETGGGP